MLRGRIISFVVKNNTINKRQIIKKIKEKDDMKKNCKNCGAELADGAKFCTSCGANLEAKNVEKTQTEYKTKQLNQPMAYTPMAQPSKIANKKLIAVLAVVAVLVVIFLVVIILLLSSSSNNFVGTWYTVSGDTYSMPTGSTMTFESNGDLRVAYASGSDMLLGKWSVEGNTLCIQASSAYSSSTPDKIYLSYSFSNDGKILTIFPPAGSTSSSTPLVLSKQ